MKIKSRQNYAKHLNHWKKANKDDKINEHETVDEKLQLGSLYIALQQMRRAAKFNLSAIDRILKLVKENPSIAFLKK